MRLMLLHVENDLNSWRWCFADEDRVRFSSVFSIDFSSKKPEEWNIHVSELVGLEQMIKICQEACDTDFITIECDEEYEDYIKGEIETILPYVTKLSAITCLDDERKGFMVIGGTPKDKCWEVQINC